MRLALLLLVLLLASPAWAKRPQSVPPHSFAIKIPPEWVSPSPDQWCTPDGNISLLWKELEVQREPAQWAAEAQTKFPGTLTNKDLKLQLGGEPAWLFVGQHLGRIQRVYMTCRGTRGVILICTCTPSQNFATIGIVQEILDSFRWLPRRG